MTIDMTMTIAEFFNIVFTALGLISTIIGGIFALTQWRKTNKLKRAEIVSTAIAKTRDDAIFAKVLYKIDYSEHWYNADFRRNREIEQEFDRVFAYMDYLCYLRSRKILSQKDFRIFEYRMQRIASCWDCIVYLFNLYHFARAQSKEMSFIHLIDYLKQTNQLPKYFFDSKNKHIQHYLNF